MNFCSLGHNTTEKYEIPTFHDHKKEVTGWDLVPKHRLNTPAGAAVERSELALRRYKPTLFAFLAK